MPTSPVVNVFEVSATGQALPVARAGVLHVVNFYCPAANGTAIVYDSVSSVSGTPLARLDHATSSGSISLNLDNLPFSKGLYIVLTGTGAVCSVYVE